MKNVLLCGVGGQGVILMSDILAEAVRLSGYDVKKSEVHGMSQRGGSVFSHVRWGDRVYSPIIPQGGAEFTVAFDIVEAARYLPYLKRGGKMLVADSVILPASMKEKQAKEIRKKLVQTLGKDLIMIDAAEIALEAGNRRAANTVMMRALAARLDLEPKVWRKAFKTVMPEKILTINLSIFEQ